MFIKPDSQLQCTLINCALLYHTLFHYNILYGVLLHHIFMQSNLLYIIFLFYTFLDLYIPYCIIPYCVILAYIIMYFTLRAVPVFNLIHSNIYGFDLQARGHLYWLKWERVYFAVGIIVSQYLFVTCVIDVWLSKNTLFYVRKTL